MAKHNLKELDKGQLQMMWNFLKLQRKNTCTKEDVRILKEHLDIIRQAMVQKTAGQRDTDPDTYVDFVDIGTYINFVVIEALQLRIYGGLDALEEVLPDEQRKKRKNLKERERKAEIAWNRRSETEESK